MVLVSLYCRCGGSLKARLSPAAALEVRRVWAGDHYGERCAPTNAQGAANARACARSRARTRWARAA